MSIDVAASPMSRPRPIASARHSLTIVVAFLVIGVERVPAELRVPPLLDRYVERPEKLSEQ